VSTLKESAPNELEAFAAAVAHELRTPLAALSGEVDIALRRERSAAAYRDALARVAISVAELVELTGDLTLFGEQSDDDPLPARQSRLDRVLARMIERYASIAATSFDVHPSLWEMPVAGDEALLARAVSLVIEHAVRHRRNHARLSIRVKESIDPRRGAPGVEIVIEAGAGAFWPQTWQGLVGSPPDARARAVPALTIVPLRLRTADLIIRRCGGSLHTFESGGAAGVTILLRYAEHA
jgi:signal transduction histidine kinase